MPKKTDEPHYNNSVKWINKTLKYKRIPEPCALQDDRIFLSEPDIKALVAEWSDSLFQKSLDRFLQCVAYGEQDKVDVLFTKVYERDVTRIQKALKHRNNFIDYSGRTFNCTAYEYAYWAKDTHMCRMLESHMDTATKACMLTCVNEIESKGLSYTQGTDELCTKHFDLTPLIKALQLYVDNHDEWSYDGQLDKIHAAWMSVGKQQRELPAHVAQEYCHPYRSFYPCPLFGGFALPRVLTVLNLTTLCESSWFPLASSNSGLGFDFAFSRWSDSVVQCGGDWAMRAADHDLRAIVCLDKKRTAELVELRELLNPPAKAPSMSM